MMKQQNFRILGDHDADYCLIQAIDQHDEQLLEKEFEAIRERCKDKKVLLAAFLIDDWLHDLSPWKAPAAFGKTDFGEGANDTLNFVLNTYVPYLTANVLTKPSKTHFVIGGYSLAALFALWAITQTNRFDACAAASPSVWFPNWMAYASTCHFQANTIYLSLGNKESKSKNPLLAHVGENMENFTRLLKDKKMIFEWNEGGHFVQSDVRTAKAFAWCIEQLSNAQ